MSLIETLKAEYADLILPRFTEAEALELGQILLLKAAGLPVVINIRTSARTLFHAALPGSAPMNDAWARRKSNCALFFHKPSLLVGEENSIKDQDFSAHGLNAADYADHGGAVPIRVALWRWPPFRAWPRARITVWSSQACKPCLPAGSEPQKPLHCARICGSLTRQVARPQKVSSDDQAPHPDSGTQYRCDP
jgi:uncharacterized protein (UPF0303 family)